MSEQLRKARALFPGAGTKGQQLLRDVFGADAFLLKTTERITCFDDVLEITGKELKISDQDDEDDILYKKAKLIVMAYNTNLETGKLWKPDYSNSSQAKWSLCYEGKPGGGLSFDDVDYWYSMTTVGPRLVFEKKEHAYHARETFPEIFDKLYNY